MPYPWPGVRTRVYFIIQKLTLSSTPIRIPRNKGKERARNKFTFIATKYVQNVTKLKPNFLNSIFHYFSNFLHLFLGYFSTSFTHAFKTFENKLVSIDIYFYWTKNSNWKFFLFLHLIILNRNELRYSSL